MTTYRMWPIDVEALQFTGENWAEMHEFTGHAVVGTDKGGNYGDVFISMGDFLKTATAIERVMMPDADDVTGVIWNQIQGEWQPVRIDDWIIKSRDMFGACPDDVFRQTYTEVAEPSTDEPTEPGFYYGEGSANSMIYLLDTHGQWYALFDNRTIEKCVWGYIEQSISAYPLKRVGN